MLALLPAGLARDVPRHEEEPAPRPCSGCAVRRGAHLTHWGFLNFVGAHRPLRDGGRASRCCSSTPTRGARRRARRHARRALLHAHLPLPVRARAASSARPSSCTPRRGGSGRSSRRSCPPLALFAAVARRAPRGRRRARWARLAFRVERLAELVPATSEAASSIPPRRGDRRELPARGVVALVSLLAFAVRVACPGVARRATPGARASRSSRSAAPGVSLCCSSCCRWRSGLWWYVYPREAIAAGVPRCSALFPDLPRRPPAPLRRSSARSRSARSACRTRSPRATRLRPGDGRFPAITRRSRRRRKLLYLVFDHGGSTSTTTPFIHLPAYVQAEKGGWLSFHFAGSARRRSVYRRRPPGAVVPPPFPTRWEWTPQLFRVNEHGPFFDWFLVRSRTSPAAIFQADPTIVPVEHTGTWWLYRRDRSPQ